MSDKHMRKYLKRAIFESTQSKALNKHIGACLVPAGGEIPIGAYNGAPRGIPEIDNWDRFHEDTYDKLIDALPDKAAYWGEAVDPRYLLGYGSGEGLKYQIDAHSERNAIINAARAGISPVGSTLYLTCGIPCKECAIEIVQAGIKTVYAAKTDLGLDHEDGGDYNFYFSRWLLKKGGVELIEYEEKILDELVEEMKNKNQLPMGVK